MDLISVRGAVEARQVVIRWVPSRRQLADPLTKSMDSDVLDAVLASNKWSLVPTADEEAEEQHLKGLRRAQRERRKERMKGSE